jgi:hypothetical protein
MLYRKFTAIVLACLMFGPAFAAEQGTGYYAADCQYPDPGYDITIYNDGTADVMRGNKAYRDVMTSYSFFGDTTPSDFLLAILFDPSDNPLPDYKGSSGWIEIWEGENSYIALENGRASKQLNYCAANAGEMGGSQQSGEPESWVVANVPANDVLNVRAGPSTKNEIVGALANGDRVSNLGGCRKTGSQTWCEIKMVGDMPFAGWVNARYLR